jgi:hypothetical protein
MIGGILSLLTIVWALAALVGFAYVMWAPWIYLFGFFRKHVPEIIAIAIILVIQSIAVYCFFITVINLTKGSDFRSGLAIFAILGGAAAVGGGS